MTDPQHKGGWTPGPWTFRSDSMTGAVWAEKEFIASAYPNAPEGWDGASEYERLDEMRANARLIAAAPKLYEALEAIIPPALCGESWNLPDGDRVEIVITFGKLRAARAALAKASPDKSGGA